MYTVKLLTTLVENHQILAYTVIFLGLIFEGEVVVITTGVLAYLGALDFTLSLVFIFTGSFVKTFVLYYLGEILNKNLVTINFFNILKEESFILCLDLNKNHFGLFFYQNLLWVQII